MSWPPYRIMQPAGARLIQTPPPFPGEGMLAKLGEKVASLDAVHTFDRTLGKTETIPLKGKMAEFSKISGNLSAGEAIGKLAGPLYA